MSQSKCKVTQKTFNRNLFPFFIVMAKALCQKT